MPRSVRLAFCPGARERAIHPPGREPSYASSCFPPSVDAGGRSSGRFEQVYRHSLEQPEEFWAQAAAEIDWVQPWERVLDDSRAPFYRWFAGGRLNTCYNALDRHVDAAGPTSSR